MLWPDDTPGINVREIAAQGGRVYRVNGLIDDCGAIVGKGAGFARAAIGASATPVSSARCTMRRR